MTRKDALKQIEIDLAKAIDKAVADGRAGKVKIKKVFVGNSLALWVRGNSASWIYYCRDGAKMKTQSLGTYPDVTLYSARQARNRLAATRRSNRTGERQHAQRTVAVMTAMTTAAPAKRARFADIVEMFIANSPMAASWKASSTEPHKYRKLKDGALGKLWTDEIDKLDVRDELQSRWGHSLRLADKNRIRIKQVCDYARSSGYRAENATNPANNDDMKNMIAKSVPHPALPLQDVAAFMGRLVSDGSQSPERWRSLSTLSLGPPKRA